MINDIQFYEVRKGKLRAYRRMKTVTLTEAQQQFIKDNRPGMTLIEISKALNISFGRLVSNMYVMGMVKKRRSMNEFKYLLWQYTI